MTRDTLFLLQGNRYLGAKISATHHRLEEVRKLVLEKRGRQKKQLEKELAQLNALLKGIFSFSGEQTLLDHT
ncbi:MAG: hypothetical protein QMD10_12365 [Desulfitobacteriaceae bacterium]|nr:hypothetical protein [Desulfitobacteriaceae bacterium]